MGIPGLHIQKGGLAGAARSRAQLKWRNGEGTAQFAERAAVEQV